jgi:hypothetical protein
MTARVFALHPEPPVNPRERLADAYLRFLLANQVPPSPSELIDQLTHTTDPAQRQALADQLARSAP